MSNPEEEKESKGKEEKIPDFGKMDEPVLNTEYMQELQKMADEEREKENRKQGELDKLKKEIS